MTQSKEPKQLIDIAEKRKMFFLLVSCRCSFDTKSSSTVMPNRKIKLTLNILKK